MKHLLVVIDMQNDFITGALGTKEAQAIIANVKRKVEKYLVEGNEVVFTRDTHTTDYLETQEGKKLPIIHGIKETKGWNIIEQLQPYAKKIFDKPTFGSQELSEYVAKGDFKYIELIGVCTDICVVSNALLLKATTLEAEISVDSACCAGVTPESHQAALLIMTMCQVEVN
ncbi:MAG: cysteine hydrolase [Lachnospiraceae bacterium]|nr:cysteine hydrolase [Lachnospiraceae bacterium]